jgi:hypothetical protein
VTKKLAEREAERLTAHQRRVQEQLAEEEREKQRKLAEKEEAKKTRDNMKAMSRKGGEWDVTGCTRSTARTLKSNGRTIVPMVS